MLLKDLKPVVDERNCGCLFLPETEVDDVGVECVCGKTGCVVGLGVRLFTEIRHSSNTALNR